MLHSTLFSFYFSAISHYVILPFTSWKKSSLIWNIETALYLTSDWKRVLLHVSKNSKGFVQKSQEECYSVPKGQRADFLGLTFNKNKRFLVTVLFPFEPWDQAFHSWSCFTHNKMLGGVTPLGEYWDKTVSIFRVWLKALNLCATQCCQMILMPSSSWWKMNANLFS